MNISSDRKRIAIYMAVAGLLVFFHFIRVLAPVENFIIAALNPVLKDFHFAGINIQENINNQASREDLRDENARLKDELAKRTVDESKFNLLIEENEILRESLGFLSRREYDYVMANVISRGEIGDNYNQPETLVIDKGGKDGISIGLAVVDKNGNVVGKIAEIKERSSLVYLSNNSKCKFAATILNDERTSGITEGELGLTIKMGYIPQDRQIQPGDIVVTSGLEEKVARGLLIGRIREINKENNELWQEAEIELMAEVDNLTFVSVIVK